MQEKLLIDSLSRRNKFPLHNYTNASEERKWNDDHCLHTSALITFFSVLVKKAFSTGLKLAWLQGHTHSTNFYHLQCSSTEGLGHAILQALAQNQAIVSCFVILSTVSRSGTSFAAMHLMPNFAFKIYSQELQLMQAASETLSIVLWWPLFVFCRTSWIYCRWDWLKIGQN